MIIDYKTFLASKRGSVQSSGLDVSSSINSKLFLFQRDLVKWSVRKGRCAVFADCGLGKTYIQLEWARLLNVPTLIIAPLSVARQTVKLAQYIDVSVKYVRHQELCDQPICITNYEMIDHFVASKFGAVVLDESSILKSIGGKTKEKLTDMFSQTQYRLCCTATPAPNDIAEMANHSEFLGIMSRADMLATFFVHDDNGWRLKNHATEAFYRWLASWAITLRKPSDLNYDDSGFILPELSIHPVIVKTDYKPENQLFFTHLQGITDRSKVRKDTVDRRVEEAIRLINNTDTQWIAWCGLNDESKKLSDELGIICTEVKGSDAPEYKAKMIEEFQDGKYKVLVTKPKIAGFGINLQNAPNMVFVGLSDSYESYYQCIRRAWRFGQRSEVNAYIILSDAEEAIHQNVLKKEQEAIIMGDKMIENIANFEKEELTGQESEFRYKADEATIGDAKLLLGDSCERLKELPDNSIDMSIYSPPFLSLYTYSPTERDIGNSKNTTEFYEHFGFIIREILRVTKPGRNTCCHVSQVPAMLVRDGYIGLKDFRGQTVKCFEDNGWIFHGEVCIDKDPQAQAIRTHSKGLLFVQLKRDASWLRPGLCDYILVFRKPGDNEVPILPDIDNNTWIEWARPIWYGIQESNTLNASEGSDVKDERHIAPLQLETIERCVRLWSNKGETVLSPFAGIGSEGYVSLLQDRKFIGIELKESYYQTAKRNLYKAIADKNQTDFFNLVDNK